jgi:membrane peptidoglycan carboxypeptidase
LGFQCGVMSTWRPLAPPAFWQRWLPARIHAWVRWGFRLAGVAGVGLASVVLIYGVLAQRFDIEAVARWPEETVFLDRHGVELAVPGGRSRRVRVGRDALPPFLVEALRAREDARFFEHGGVDWRGMLRAVRRNLKDGRFTQGASTLSMQLVRNTFQIREKSLHRKLLEIALTLRLENRYAKDEILTHYLNRIYFGSGAEGIEQAARTYFDKSTPQLSDGECALLVGIIRGPHIFSPRRNLLAAVEQREQTLDRLVVMGVIDQACGDRLAAEPVVLAAARDFNSQTSYALQAAERELDSLLDVLEIEPGGLRVTTTLDRGWQHRLEQELTRAVEELEKEKSWKHSAHAAHAVGAEPAYVQYAAVTTGIESGATLALIGGRDFGHSRFDRTRSSRDLGGAFSPFMAAAAADRGRPVLPDQPVQMGRSAGVERVIQMARRCGLSGPFLETEDLFRGSVAATPAEMAVGLATLANGGRRPHPHLIHEVHGAGGQLIYRAPPRQRPGPAAAAASQALQVFQNSGGTRHLTAATRSERDAWMLRLGPNGATALWIGFDQPTPIAPRPRLESLLNEFVQRLENK